MMPPENERRNWKKVSKSCQGGRAGSSINKIRVSKNFSRARGKIRLRIGIPKRILKSANIYLTDYVTMRYCDDFCELLKTDDITEGYKVCGKTKGTPNISTAMSVEMLKVFFKNGQRSYLSTAHEVSYHSIMFTLS